MCYKLLALPVLIQNLNKTMVKNYYTQNRNKKNAGCNLPYCFYCLFTVGAIHNHPNNL